MCVFVFVCALLCMCEVVRVYGLGGGVGGRGGMVRCERRKSGGGNGYVGAMRMLM